MFNFSINILSSNSNERLSNIFVNIASISTSFMVSSNSSTASLLFEAYADDSP